MRAALFVAVVVMCGAAALVAASGSATATTVGPYQPPPLGSGACPSVPLLPGQKADFQALIAFLQPGATQGTTCALPDGGTLVGDQLIVLLYTPNAVPNGTVAVGVEEFQTHTRQVAIQQGNHTLYETQTYVSNVLWSNTSLTGAAGVAQDDVLTVPDVAAQENLTVSILGLVEQFQIVVPGAGIAVPANYPQLLFHDFAYSAAVVFAFIVGVGFATAIRLRVRHVPLAIVPLAMVIVGLIAFGDWFYSDYPASLIAVGTAPEAVFALPIFFVGVGFWWLLFPTEARWRTIEFPVADTKDGQRLYGKKTFRVFRGPDGLEYIGPRGAGFWLRLLGVRTLLDDRALTEHPHFQACASYRSVRADIEGRYFAWAEVDGGPKVLDVVSPRVWILPWRKRTREAIEAHYKAELRGKETAPTHLGFFLHVSKSRAFAAVVGTQNATMVQGWSAGTLHSSRVGWALERFIVAYATLAHTLRVRAIDFGHKLATAMRMAEEMPDDPHALAALEELATHQEAELLNEGNWYRELDRRVQEERASRVAPSPLPTTPADVLREARDERKPPEWRGKSRRSGV
ncbi:MAG TPA: hypothetical protein VFF67_10265 [Thermoplasmata archaeon]|nr:hypothetical protein [Thermoplasmata archaeon]